MTRAPLYPLDRESDWLQRYARLPLHQGTVRVAANQDDGPDGLADIFRRMRAACGHSAARPEDLVYRGSFLIPAQGNALIILHSEERQVFSRVFGTGLTMRGECEEGPFELQCPEYYVRDCSRGKEQQDWAVAEPVNKPVRITYGPSRLIASVQAVINNFDFEHGNVRGLPGTESLRIEACGRTIQFCWREDHEQLRRLVATQVLRTTALTTFQFDAWDGATTEELAEFADNIAGLCGIVGQQHTGIPVLSFLDGAGKVVERRVREPLESRFRSGAAIRWLHFEDGMPMLFKECFEEYVRMSKSDMWRRLPSFIMSAEDSPYLEQRVASLMAGVELFLRHSLTEAGYLTANDVKMLPELIGMARGQLRWNVPRHYTKGNRHSRLRNAVAHANELPDDPPDVRYDFDKWLLFLTRRFLIRLGFKGKVASPRGGIACSSPVDAFGQEDNDFSHWSDGV